MKEFYLVILLTICTHVFLAIDIEGPLCFHFTWPGADKTTDKNLTCEDLIKNNSFTPCIDPLHISETKPNTNEIWTNKTENFKYVKKMEFVCVKFTYIYNGAVVNISYFSGKVTEDRIMPVTSGCYAQYTDGYKIEVCACKSKDNTIPCNSTIRNTSSILIISVVAAITLFTYKIFDIL
ncbi:uncharacterized protein LOC105194608 [Solenopsis invicta]|uniref:uncharacterized protein LOC105194608 n=1 Tax=Solenopsis invicta TaxID=13686 RepID=UPI00193D58FE|nr:uncharacterized protein LOC105194608 [Solenopsis invicta]